MAFELSTMDLPLLEPQEPRPITPTASPASTKLQPRPKGLRKLPHWCAETAREVWTDLRLAKWEDGLLWVPLLWFWIVLVQFCIRMCQSDPIFRSWGAAGAGAWGLPACMPDGSIGSSMSYDQWGLAGLFQITLRFGPLSFTQAKVIDVVWDVVVGRLGQSALAYYSWKSLSAYVRVSMDARPVTFDTYLTTYLDEAASLKSTAKMIRDFSTRQRLRSRLVMPVIIATMLFILAWPTLAGAMTGYSSAETAYMTGTDGNLVLLTKLVPVSYVIHDGDRIGLEPEYLVTSENYRAPGEPCKQSAYSTGPCLAKDVAGYIEKYMLGGLEADPVMFNDSTEWMGDTLQPPLSISVFDLSYDFERPSIEDTDYFRFNRSNAAYTTEDYNRTYLFGYIEANSRCQTLEAYEWGFSFLQLFIDMLLLLSWVLGMWLLWLKAHIELSRRKNVQIPGKFRAVLDLAAAIQHSVSALGETADTLTTQQLADHIKTRLRGGDIKTEAPSATSKYTYWAWLAQHEGWIIVLSVVAIGTSWAAQWMTMNLIITGTGVSAALCIGRSTRSRIALFFCVSVIMTSLIWLLLIFARGSIVLICWGLV